jgi:hypothetical protein
MVCVGLRELFLPMLGNWTGVEQQAASAWGPATTARAMIVFKLDVGDQVVVQDYRQVRADHGEFSGHGVFMIDKTDVTSQLRRCPFFGGFSTRRAIRRSRRRAAGTMTS